MTSQMQLPLDSPENPMLLSPVLNDFRVMSRFQIALVGHDSKEENPMSIVRTVSGTEQPIVHEYADQQSQESPTLVRGPFCVINTATTRSSAARPWAGPASDHRRSSLGGK